MAKRVNTRFVVILAVVLVVLSGGLVLAWHFARTTSAEHIAQGKTMMANGKIDLAIEQFGKALNKVSQDSVEDVPLLMIYSDALSKAQVTNDRDARDYLMSMQGAWEKALHLDPSNPDAFAKLMNLYMRFGRDLGASSFWTLMYDRCQDMLSRRPDRVEAIRFRGIAQTNLMGALDILEEDRLQAKQDLQAAIERNPKNLNVRHYLAVWHLKEADIVGGPPEEDTEKAERLRQQARESSDQTFAQYGEDPEARLNHVLVLMELGDRELAAPLLEKLEKQMLETPVSVRATLQLANMLSILNLGDPGPGWQRAEVLVRSALENWPSQAPLYYSLGEVLYRVGKRQEAIDIFKQGSEIVAEADPVDAHLLSQTQWACTLKYFELRLSRPFESEQERAEFIDEANVRLERAEAIFGTIWQINRMRGKLAMVQAQWEKARIEFDNASAKLNDESPELLMLSAKARAESGDLGAAADRYRSLISLRADHVPAKIALASLHLRLNELNEAQTLIYEILKEDDQHPVGLRLKAALHASRDEFDQAIAIYEQLNPAENPELILSMASVYVRAEERAKGRELFESYFEDHPANVTVLRQLIALSSDKERSMAYLEQAREAGVNQNVMDILTAQVSGEGVDQVLEKIIEGSSALQQHLSRYAMLKQQGKFAESLVELDAAAKTDPNNKIVIESQFSEALARSDWKKAENQAVLAGNLNLDLAQGNFYYGRLYYVKRQFDRAVASFQAGMRHRSFSEGWRQLGDAHLAMSDLTEATTAFQSAIKERPNNVAALRGLARVYDKRKDTKNALAQLLKALEYTPNDWKIRAEYLKYEQRHGKPEVALESCRRRIQEKPDDMNNRRALVVLLADLEQYEEAIKTIDKVIEEDGESSENILTKARVLANSDDMAGGRQIIQNYVNALGDKATAADWMVLGRFLFRGGDVNAGRSVYRRAMQLENSDSRRASRELADWLFDRQELDEANELYGSLWNDRPSDKAIGLRFVESLIRNKELERAEQVLAELERHHDDDGITDLVEGMLARAKGDTDRALSAFTGSIARSPHSALAYYQRAQLLSNDRSNDDRVMPDLNKALELNGNLAVARRLLANIHLRRGEFDDAIREFLTLLRRKPQDEATRRQLAELYFRKDSRRALRELLDESAELFSDDPFWPLSQSQLALREHRVHDAIGHLRDALNLKIDPGTITQLATLLIRAHEPHQVLELLREYAELTGRSPQLQAVRGQALIAVGRAEEASGAFALAMQNCESFSAVFAVAQQIRFAVGLDRAIQELAAVASGHQVAWVELAMAQLQIDRHDYAAALALLSKVDTRLAPDAAERNVYDNWLVLAQHQSNDYPAARITYERILKRDPNDLRTLNNLAYILANDLNEAHRGVELAKSAVNLRKQDPNLLDTLGFCQFKAGQITDARRTLEQSIQMKKMASNSLHLAQVLLKLNDTQAARELLESAGQLAEQSNDTHVLEQAGILLQELVR